MYLVGSFVYDILFTSFQQKNEIKLGNYPNEIQTFTFWQEQAKYLFDGKDIIWQMVA